MEARLSDLVVRRASMVFGYDQPGPLAVVIRGGLVERVVPDLGPEGASFGEAPELDAAGRAVVPGFVDAQTHLVFAGDRGDEFAARLAGRRYEAGGIMRTVGTTRSASSAALLHSLAERAAACLAGGTTTVEVKSGYGLDTATELRLLEVVASANADPSVAVELVPTFLGAHLDAGPGYIDRVIDEMLPAVAQAGLATSCDAFCDLGALTLDQSRRVLSAAQRYGMAIRIHAEELAHTGAARLAAELGCLSADHLVHATPEDAQALAGAGVVAVLLPATSFSLRSAYAPARMLLDAGVTLALASDCNPGTSYTSSMPFVIALACSAYGVTVAQAVRAATEGGARALGRHDIGHLRPGARGDLVVLRGSDWVDLAYRPGMPAVDSVVKDGRVVYRVGPPGQKPGSLQSVDE